MLSSIPISRLVLYFMLIGLLPIIVAGAHFLSKRSEIEQVRNGMEYIREMAALHQKKQSLNLATRDFFRFNDHFYIDKNIESLPLLENEIESIQKILKQNNFIENDVLKKRLEFLTTTNTLVFSEGVVQAYPYFRETVETLVHPVEVDVSDLEKILAKIEGVEIGSQTPGPNRPQLLITEFKLDKKKTSDKNEVFTLNLKLIKREFF